MAQAATTGVRGRRVSFVKQVKEQEVARLSEATVDGPPVVGEGGGLESDDDGDVARATVTSDDEGSSAAAASEERAYWR